MTHRYSMFSALILKGQKMKYFIHRDCDQITAEPRAATLPNLLLNILYRLARVTQQLFLFEKLKHELTFEYD